MKKEKLLLIVSICLALMLSMLPLICAGQSVTAKPAGELRIGVPSLLTETFHPFWAPGNRKFYLTPLYDSLLGLDGDGNLDPKESIAYKWEEAPDRLSWTFWIRDGVKFHDGTPLTLEDVKFSLDTMLDEKNVCVRSIFKGVLNRVEVVPPNKVVVYLSRLWPTMPYFLCPSSEGGGIILSKKYLEKVSPQYYEANPIGTGPYRFLEKKESDYIKYVVAQDNHWRVGTPKYKYLTFKTLPEEGTREAALRSKEVDLIQVGLTRADQLEKMGFTIHEKKGSIDMIIQMLRMYEPDNPLNKLKVRQALVYAIDKTAILKHVLLGRGKLIGHFYSMFSWSISYKDYPVAPYDPKKAKEFLAEAGYPNGFTIYMYSFVQNVPEQKLVTEAIAGYWKAIGMDVKILEIDIGAFMPIWTKKKQPAGPAVAVYSWASRRLDVWKPLYNSDVERYYFSQTNDPVLDKLIDKYDTVATMDEFIKADRACEERVLEMFYNTGLFATSLFFASSKDVPKWSLGKENTAYRFEYVGAAK